MMTYDDFFVCLNGVELIVSVVSLIAHGQCIVLGIKGIILRVNDSGIYSGK